MDIDPKVLDYLGPGAVSLLAGASGAWAFFYRTIVPFFITRQQELENLYEQAQQQASNERDLCDEKINNLKSQIEKEREAERQRFITHIGVLEKRLGDVERGGSS